MAALQSLKPGELLRLVNSTRLGAVLSEPVLRRQRQAAGLRIGDGKTIDFLKYAAWLAEQAVTETPSSRIETETAAAAESNGEAAYAKKKERERNRSAERSRMGRDIGPLPDPADGARRTRAESSFAFFCINYFPDLFPLAFCPDHHKAIAKIEHSVCQGSLFAFAMPRGSGKTTMSEVAAIWATITGRRKFVALIGASRPAAAESLDAIKTQLETNDRLAADWPEVCLPVRRLEGRAALAPGQLCNGERTRIVWGKSEILLPTVAGSAASGAIIKAAGLTGRIRGMKHQRADGESARPDFVIVDDPQTRASAHSDLQVATRLQILNGDVLMLAGPTVRLSGVCPCTVIRAGDLADQLLTRRLHPEWGGERWKMLYALPNNLELWDQYATIYRAGLELGDDGHAGNEFYTANREAMDAGAIVAWPEQFDANELSGIQHAMNLRLRDAHAFACECQNEPPDDKATTAQPCATPEAIAGKINQLPRRTIPLAATHLTGFIDVQHAVLYYAVVAWWDGFGGAVVDYGTFPDQGQSYFTLRQLTRRLPGTNVQEAVFQGLGGLVEQLMGAEWPREGGGASPPLSRLLIDAGDGALTETISLFCRTSPRSALLLPSGGRGIGPGDRPLATWQRRPGDRFGDHWLIQRSTRFGVRQVVIDTNFWKSFVAERWLTPRGGRSALELYGARGVNHQMFADHQSAETRDRQTSERTKQTCDVWRLTAGKENHWLDCMVGATVAASIEGVAILKMDAPTRRKITAADIPQRRAR